MIVPMKKVSIVLLDKEKREALKSLRHLGVVHLEALEGQGEELKAYKQAYDSAVASQSILGEIKAPKKLSQKALNKEETVKKCQEIVALTEEKKQLLGDINSSNLELERFSGWGDIDPAAFAELKGDGIDLRLFEVSEDKYELIGEELETLLVNKSKRLVRFLLINGGEDRPKGLPSEAFEVSLPAVSSESLRKKIAANQERIKAIDKALFDSVSYGKSISELKKLLDSDIEFETVYSGMGCDEKEGDADLAWLSGYVPQDSYNELKGFVAKNGWAMVGSDPGEDDAVPTKLKNNRLVSLIYPLTDFLGTVPGYHEYDISGWFLLFFTVFFGMIFGDGGYGLLVTVGALFAIVKCAAGGKKAPPMISLMLLLGLSTVVWGLVTCTWFGLSPDMLPAWLTNLSVPPLSNAFSDVTWLPFWSNDASNGTLTTAQNLQIFCFTLAFLQLSVAHIKGIGRYHKSLKCIGELGSLLQLWGMYYVVLSMVVSSSIFSFSEVVYGVPIGLLSVGLVGAGFMMSFVFANYDGSVLESVMASLKGIISVLLGVVNVFSDIVSYIRLWAVGLAGAAISNTVNTMAGPILGHAILFVAAIVLLVFGHGLNMVLNLLSVIVHGVRLNTLEFSTHLGMSWSGFKYAPFSDK